MTIISQPRLRALVAFASAQCEKFFQEKGQIDRMWHAIRADGSQFVIMPSFDSKQTETASIRALFEEQNVTRYIVMTEAWALQVYTEAEASSELARFGSVGKHPERIEMLYFFGEDQDEGFLMADRRIVRDADGKGQLTAIRFHDQVDAAEGNMIGLLPARGPRQ